ncbi:thiol-disulfide isomerase/thioredoxin [Motilibacter rhizosphaerae]|uniref:Thiol-disulfide isomerase/thioredoxin n=1 Tax=Motilibacter rhizosphaerae TaxID=598652 RepID=A0A4Q7NX83_9ACTN|nr:NHL domain-containing thioredoxin family protein [Motilibacter rhizosphaerae]RZS91012.1 thiol-disulfide isomerase/thioredoxin [Motilibacter rhizosphaerae]
MAVRAPELTGRSWLGTGGRALSLQDLRGRFVLLDFWTFCCINCLHVLDELRPLEEAYADALVVVGVHSPKFRHEADPEALAQAVERYGITHPVLDDAALTTWRSYAVRAWPTLVLVDPEGYVVAQLAGEGHALALGRILEEQVPLHEAGGTLRRGSGPYVPAEAPATELRFPGKLLALPGGDLLVSDSARHSLVRLSPELEVLQRLGSGVRGRRDSASTTVPEFAEPQGLCLLPPDVAAEVGYDVVVADTANHLLRGLRLADGRVTTVAGTGRQWMPAPDGSTAHDLSSPWDVAWWDDRVWVAMAGIHQLWTFDPRTGEAVAAAGTRNEGLVDGPAGRAWFAQPSGLAAAGDALLVADSETSAVRRVVRTPEGYAVETLVGQGLFDFGHVDGPAAEALLQHPLGVAADGDGVLVADTYNGAVRRWDSRSGSVSTVLDGLAEPSDVLPLGDGTALIVESSAHRVVRRSLSSSTSVTGERSRTQRPPTDLAPGEVRLDVVFAPPPGQHLDERWGPSTRLHVSSTPEALLRSGSGRGAELSRVLDLDPSVGDGVLHIAATAASCDDEGGESAACHVTQQDWGVPVRVTAGAADVLRLPLLG